MDTFSIREAVTFGWHTFVKRPWFFIGINACVFVAYGVLSAVSDGTAGAGVMSFLVSAAVLLLGIVIEILLINIALKSHDSVETVEFSDAWKRLPFWPYLGVKILNGVIVIVGLILLIVPGIIAALALLFSNYLVVDKNLGPMEALKESVRITKGHRWQLLLFVLAIGLLNIVGVIALLVGLLITIPVSMLAMAHVFRILSSKASLVQATSA